MKNEETVTSGCCGHVDRRLHVGVLQTRFSVQDQSACGLQLVGLQEHHIRWCQDVSPARLVGKRNPLRTGKVTNSALTLKKAGDLTLPFLTW
jgi:hypothetical protein